MLAYMLYAQKTKHDTPNTCTAGQPGPQHTTLPTDPTGNASTNGNWALNNSKAAHLQQRPPDGSATDLTLPNSHQSSQAASASGADDNQRTMHSNQQPAQPEAAGTDLRTDANSPAQPDALAVPDGVAEPPTMPASLSAQHGQNMALLGSLTCNELDATRRSRLQSVLHAYLPVPLKHTIR